MMGRPGSRATPVLMSRAKLARRRPVAAPLLEQIEAVHAVLRDRRVAVPDLRQNSARWASD
jgi:hypothetical protein